MIRLMAQMRDGRFVVQRRERAGAPPSGAELELHDDTDLCAIEAQAPCPYEIAWYDLEAPSAEDLAWLGRRFRFHPLALEDCARFDQRSKLEEYAGHLFLVAHGIRLEGEGTRPFELHCFVTRDTLVTVHDSEIPGLRKVESRFERDRNQMPKQVDFLLHRVLAEAASSNDPALTALEKQIDALEARVFETASQQSHFERISDLQRELTAARHLLSPQREMLNTLIAGSARGEIEGLSEKSSLYFRDLCDQLVVSVGWVDELRENLSSIRDAFLAMSAHRSNETMKRLTLISVIFLPLTFITGFFGMNFEHLPWKSDLLLIGTLAVIVALPVAMLALFGRRKWL